ncbi:alpha-L-rhamnosidase-related protein [Algoriphagus namhaensis]
MTFISLFRIPLVGFFAVLLAFQSYALQETAQWITHPEQSTQQNLWLKFSHQFEFSGATDQQLVHIAVDSKYWLYINGELIIYEGGLKRGPNRVDTYFDELDLGPFLAQGKNQIEVLVWFWGREGFSHKNSGKAGLFIESQSPDLKLQSDADWQVAIHPAYYTTEKENPNYRLPEFNVAFDSRKTDIRFVQAAEVGSRGAAPWNQLRKRPIPQWQNLGMKAYQKVETTETDSSIVVIGYLPKNITISPYFNIRAEAGGKIDVRTDNYIGGSEPNLRAEYITRAGDQEYESLGYLNGHQVIYTFPKNTEVFELAYRETKYDTEYLGYFRSDLQDLDLLWEKAANTMNVNMRDAIQDPDRERAQWWGDVVIILGEIFYVTDPKGVQAISKAIQNLLEWQKDDGVLFSPVPAGSWDKELPAQMLASIGEFGIWRYFEHTADTALLEFSFPYIKKYLDLWQFDENGLVVHRAGGWSWYDWGEKVDVALLDNLWMYQALTAASKIAGVAGENKLADDYKQQATKLAERIQEHFWRGDRWASPDLAWRMDDRANGLAVALGLTKEEDWELMKQELFETRFAGPYMEKYVIEAFFKMGDAEPGLDRMMDRYSEMIASPVTTLWEGWKVGSGTYGGGTYNHGWSGWPITIAGEYLAGVRPDGPGFEGLWIAPQLSDFESLDFRTPVQAGSNLVDLDYAHDGKTKSYQIELQQALPTTFVLSLEDLEKALSISIDGKKYILDTSGLPKEWNRDEEGNVLISFAKTLEVKIYY